MFRPVDESLADTSPKIVSTGNLNPLRVDAPVSAGFKEWSSGAAQGPLNRLETKKPRKTANGARCERFNSGRERRRSFDSGPATDAELVGAKRVVGG